jgi:hypothetical protein
MLVVFLVLESSASDGFAQTPVALPSVAEHGPDFDSTKDPGREPSRRLRLNAWYRQLLWGDSPLAEMFATAGNSNPFTVANDASLSPSQSTRTEQPADLPDLIRTGMTTQDQNPFPAPPSPQLPVTTSTPTTAGTAGVPDLVPQPPGSLPSATGPEALPLCHQPRKTAS